MASATYRYLGYTGKIKDKLFSGALQIRDPYKTKFVIICCKKTIINSVLRVRMGDPVIFTP
jgi:hypothetical protein